MAFTINTNMASMQAQEYLRTTGEFQAKTINRVTSGLRIINAGDDAAGLATANAFRSDQAVLSQGIRNANDGLATLQTIDSGISNIGKLLDRARTLAAQSATGTFTGSRSVLDSEFQSVLGEVDRQAQAIGLDSNGAFAKDLSVFIGGGRTNGATDQIKNGSVAIDLSNSTVDSQSLGMKGVQAGKTAYDLSSGATKVESIVNDTNNVAGLGTAGYTTFNIKGPGFGDSNGVTVRVNVNNVASTEALETAVNAAIVAAGTDPTAAAQAFKNASIKAKIVTDSDGKQQLAFSSSNASFQVSGGDKMANALLGNYKTGAEGADIVSTTTGAAGAAAGLGTFAAGESLKMRFEGGGLTSPVELSYTTAASDTAATVAAKLQTAIASDATLRAAGITMSGKDTATGLVFSSASGQDVRVGLTGDVRNNLGLGGFKAGAGGESEYNTVTLAAGSTLRNGETSRFSFSLNGGASVDLNVGWTNTSTAGVAAEASSVGVYADAAVTTVATSGAWHTGNYANAATTPVATSESYVGGFAAATDAVATSAFHVGSFASAGTAVATSDWHIGGWADTTAADVSTDGANHTVDVTINGLTHNIDLTDAAGDNLDNLVSAINGLGMGNIASVHDAGAAAGATRYSLSLTAASNLTAPAMLTDGTGHAGSAGPALRDVDVTIDGTTKTLSLDTNTVTGLASAINAAGTGFGAGTASVHTNADGTVGIGLTSNTAADLSILSNGNTHAGSVGTAAKDVDVTINGTTKTLELTTNTLTGLINAVNDNTKGFGAGTAVLHDSGTVGATQFSLGITAANSTTDPVVMADGDGNADSLGAAYKDVDVVYDGASHKVSLTGATNNLNGLRDAINGLAAGHPVASVVSDGAGAFSLKLVDATATPDPSKVFELRTTWNSGATGDAASTTEMSTDVDLVIDGTTHKISLTSGTGATNNLNGLRDAINALDLGITASVGGSGANNTLDIVADTTRMAGPHTISLLSTSGSGASNIMGATVLGVAGTSSGNLATSATMADALNAAINGTAGLQGSGLTAAVDATTKAITFTAGTGNMFRVQTSGGTAVAGTQAIQAPNMAVGEKTDVTFSVDGKAPESVSITWDAADLASDATKSAKVTAAIATAVTAGGGAASSLSGMTAAVVGDTITFTKANLQVLSAYNGGMAGAAAGYSAPVVAGADPKGYVSAGGYQLGAAGTAAPLTFSAINFAGDKQALTIQATDSVGANHKLDVALTNTNARSLDEAINTINTKLQESNDSTLKGITAVKVIEGGVEKMNLISNNKDFRLSVGANASGTGLSQTNQLISSTQVGTGGNSSISTQADAQAAVTALAQAVTTLGRAQAVVGKGQNQFNFAVSLASTQLTNLAASESRIRDADLALEAANLSKAQILTQAGVAAMAQANSAPQAVLSLLRG